MAQEACVNIEVIIMGPIANNVYIIDDGETTLVVDPTEDAPRILEVLGQRKPSAIVLTHGHWDHVGAAYDLREATGARTIASAADAPIIEGARDLGPMHISVTPCPVDQVVHDGDMVEIGAMKWRVMETPGHTPGSMCLYLDPSFGADPEGAPVLISGDTLFAGAHGRTDFEKGDPAAMAESLKRLAKLPAETHVLPGHESLTTIGHELDWLPRGVFR